MEESVIKQIKLAGLKATENNIRKIVYWNRKEYREHSSEEIKIKL